MDPPDDAIRVGLEHHGRRSYAHPVGGSTAASPRTRAEPLVRESCDNRGMDGVIARSARRRTVVTAMPLPRPARARLAELLDADVVDMRTHVAVADLVLAPSCSPRTVAAIKRAFPDARVVIVEIEDWRFDVEFPGPVMRLIDAGADAYVTADGLDELAERLGAGNARVDAERSEPAALPAPGVDDAVLANIREVVARRAATSDNP